MSSLTEWAAVVVVAVVIKNMQAQIQLLFFCGSSDFGPKNRTIFSNSIFAWPVGDWELNANRLFALSVANKTASDEKM